MACKCMRMIQTQCVFVRCSNPMQRYQGRKIVSCKTIRSHATRPRPLKVLASPCPLFMPLPHVSARFCLVYVCLCLLCMVLYACRAMYTRMHACVWMCVCVRVHMRVHDMCAHAYVCLSLKPVLDQEGQWLTSTLRLLLHLPLCSENSPKRLRLLSTVPLLLCLCSAQRTLACQEASLCLC